MMAVQVTPDIFNVIAPASLDDWRARDYDAVLQQGKRENPGLPLFAIGHSFGGQCAPLLPSRDLLSGLVNIAVFPVLALTFADDELLLEAGSRLVHAAYRDNEVDYRLVSPGDHGLPRIGHSGFFRPSAEGALWPLVAEWLETRSSASRDGRGPPV